MSEPGDGGGEDGGGAPGAPGGGGGPEVRGALGLHLPSRSSLLQVRLGVMGVLVMSCWGG